MFNNIFISFYRQIISCVCILLLLILSACSSSRTAVYYQRFDFDQVKNFSFYNSDSDYYDSLNLNYVQRSRIELAVEKSLAEQNFNYSDLNEADMLVTYHIVTKESSYRAYNKVVGFCSQCLRANLWVKEKNSWQPYPNGLIIDLVSPKTNRSVWRSIAPLNFKTKDSSSELNRKINEAVNLMLEQYPKE